MWNVKPLLIRRLPAVCCAVKVGMLLDGVFFIHYRALPANKNQGLAVIQHPYLIGHEQFTSRILIVNVAGAAASSGNTACPRVDRLFAERLGDIFVRAGFVASQIEQGVTVTGHVLPTVLEQFFELRHVLNHNIDGNLTASAGGQDTFKIFRQRNIRKFVHQNSNWYWEPAAVSIVCRIVQLLKCLSI